VLYKYTVSLQEEVLFAAEETVADVEAEKAVEETRPAERTASSTSASKSKSSDRVFVTPKRSGLGPLEEDAEDASKLLRAAAVLFRGLMGAKNPAKDLDQTVRLKADVIWATVARFCIARGVVGATHSSRKLNSSKTFTVLTPKLDASVPASPSGGRVVHPGRLSTVPHEQQAHLIAHILAFEDMESVQNAVAPGPKIKISHLVDFARVIVDRHREWEHRLASAFESMDVLLKKQSVSLLSFPYSFGKKDKTPHVG
jgi:hypothetical protein